MAAAVYLTNVSGGCCLTKIANGVNNQTCAGSAAQKWIAEPGPQPHQVALKSTDDGQYLHATSGAAYGAITTGAKQLWTLEPGVAHGSFWLKCNDYPDAYLASKSGNYVSNNPVYCWPKQAVWTHALTWYLQDTTATDFVPTGKATTAAQDVDKQTAALAEREAAVKKEDAARLEKEADLKKVEAAAAEKEAALKKKEAELAAKEEELAAKEKELQEAKQASQQPNGYTNASPAGLAIKDAALKQKEADLAVQDNAQQQTNGTDIKPSSLANGTDLEAENVRLRAEVDRLRDPLRLTRRSDGGGMRSVRAPGFQLSTGFDPVLLARFEEGKKATLRTRF